MAVTDPAQTALALALHAQQGDHASAYEPPDCPCAERASVLLAALPGRIEAALDPERERPVDPQGLAKAFIAAHDEDHAQLERLREAARAVVKMAEYYASEDRWGLYPLLLFEQVALLRHALDDEVPQLEEGVGDRPSR